MTLILCVDDRGGLSFNGRRQSQDRRVREDLLPTLTPQDLAGLSNKAFRRTYGHRAFAWRGIAPLRRNLALQGEGLSPTPQKKPPAPDENRRSG